jgi:signal transduction histidine kinase
VERWRLRLVDFEPTPDPHRTPPWPGYRSWLATRLREQATWRELAYTLLLAVALWILDLAVLVSSFATPALLLVAPIEDSRLWPLVPVGLMLLPVVPFALTAWAAGRVILTRTLLAPRDAELGERLVEVTRSRARIVDAFEVERRRIERDLHDGAQQRLVALTVKLGLARLDLPPGSPAAEHIDQAQEQAKQALAEMRELIRGVHAQVLSDRGLPAAISDVAGRSPVPVTVDVELPRLPAPVESVAYFAVCEALANVAKHSEASTASVRGRVARGHVVVEVRDDGVGGADPAGGTGLTGLADRISVVDGRLMLSSPAAGPSLLRVEIPWRRGDRSGSPSPRRRCSCARASPSCSGASATPSSPRSATPWGCCGPSRTTRRTSP